MKKTVLLAFISAFLALAVAGTLLIDFGTASPLAPALPSIGGGDILVMSPDDNKAYAVNSIPLVFAIGIDSYYLLHAVSIDVSIRYSLDGKLKGQIESKLTRDSFVETFSVNLTGLSDGLHRVQVTAKYDVNAIFGASPVIGFSDIVCFTVDTTPPRISIWAPLARTYNATDIALNFTVNEPVTWMGYSLDGQTNVTITGNTTITELSEGSHSLTVYAKDTAGNTGYSKTIYFSIAQKKEPEQTPPFPTWIVAAIVIIAVVGAALMVYFRKTRKTTGEGEIVSEGVM